jgi:SAM-dependent methyltransferase
MISPKAGDSVLDIGSGSGESAAAVVRQHADASITLLDGSPQMVGILRERFQHAPQVNIALCQLPSGDGSSIDLGDARFSFIVIHQTLKELARSFGSLDEVAVWCRSRLRPDGQLLVTAHNTFVVAHTEGWDGWRDPFRAGLARVLRRKVAKSALRVTQAPIQEQGIVEPFLRGGFKLMERNAIVSDVSWEERQRLWKVPAVMDSVVETTAIPMTDRDRIVDEIIDAHKGERTMPRTVIIWRFSPVDTRSLETGA